VFRQFGFDAGNAVWTRQKDIEVRRCASEAGEAFPLEPQRTEMGTARKRQVIEPPSKRNEAVYGEG